MRVRSIHTFTPEIDHDLSRGTIVNKTYCTHKNGYIHISLFSLITFGPTYCGPRNRSSIQSSSTPIRSQNIKGPF